MSDVVDDEPWLQSHSRAFLPKSPDPKSKSDNLTVYNPHFAPLPTSFSQTHCAAPLAASEQSILSILEPFGANDTKDYRGPLTLQESAETPLLTRQRTAELLRSKRGSAGGGQHAKRVSRGKSGAATRKRFPKALLSTDDLEKSERCVACIALSSQKPVLAGDGADSNQACTEERSRALASLKSEFSALIDVLAAQGSCGSGCATEMRLQRCASALRVLSLSRVADWLVEMPTNNAEKVYCERIFALLHIVFDAGNVRIASSGSGTSQACVTVPPTIGDSVPYRDALLRRKIDDLLFLDEDKSCFTNKDARQVLDASASDVDILSCSSASGDSQQESKSTAGADDGSATGTVDGTRWTLRRLAQVEAAPLWRCVCVLVESHAANVDNAVWQYINLHSACPRVWAALKDKICTMDAANCARLACIADNRAISLLEFALSGVLFAAQSFERAVQSCYEKICAFPERLWQKVLANSAEAYDVFWFSHNTVQFERRMDVLTAIERCERNESGHIANAPLARLRANLQRCAKRRGTTLVALLDRLGELHERNMLRLLEPLLSDDWRRWRGTVQERETPLTALQTIMDCPHTRTLGWTMENTGLSAAQKEMAALDVVALQRRLDAALDAERQPVHERMISSGLAVDDSNLVDRRTPLPVLVCYERSLPVRNEATDVDLAPVTARGGKRAIFRAYGVFLYTYSPERSASRFALMMWLSPPYAGEIVLALTPFCQGLIDHYVSNSDRTSAPGFTGLKYYSQTKANFLPVAQLLPKKKRAPNSALGVYNRIEHTRALELRRAAQLRQVKSLRAPKPPPLAQSRDAAYLAYSVDDKDDNVFRNYVHPAAAARLFDAGFSAALRVLGRKSANRDLEKAIADERQCARAEALKGERDSTRTLLSTWTQNFFENEKPREASAGGKGVAQALEKKKRTLEPAQKSSLKKQRRAVPPAPTPNQEDCQTSSTSSTRAVQE